MFRIDCSYLNSSNESEDSFKSVVSADFDDIEETITIEKIIWSINSLSPFKSPREDGIFPALLQKAEKTITPILQKFF